MLNFIVALFLTISSSFATAETTSAPPDDKDDYGIRPIETKNEPVPDAITDVNKKLPEQPFQIPEPLDSQAQIKHNPGLELPAPTSTDQNSNENCEYALKNLIS